MKFELRPHRKGETDHELLWLLVGAVSLGAAWAWLQTGLPWPRCVFHECTGVPCLTCGATRCFLFLAHGRFGAAFWMNPLAFCALIASGVFAVYAFVVLLLRLPRVRVSVAAGPAGAVRLGVLALLLTNWIYLIAAGRL